MFRNISKEENKEDGSYEVVCNYCEKCSKQDNQMSTSFLKHHIMKGCKKISWAKRHSKLDALQKMLQADNTIGEIQIIILTY
jgi:hypothetical protein